MIKFRRFVWSALLLVSVTAQATLIYEKFATNPAADGWQSWGATNLFRWDATNRALAVTWDSSESNSYYYHPLDRSYTKADGFCVQFDLNLTDASAVGYFQMAIGLGNFSQLSSTGFSRANGASPDLCEFDYFPGGPASYGPSMDATLVDANDIFCFAYDASQPMNTNVVYRVVLVHPPGATAINGTVFTNGVPMSALPEFYLESSLGDFQLDTLAVLNYTTLDDAYGDSLLAHGTVANFAFASPLPVGLVQASGQGSIAFSSDTNWIYTLEQTTDFKTWTATAFAAGNGTNLLLQATNPPSAAAFYRVQASLP